MIENLKKIFISIFGFLVIVLLVKVSGWSPINLLLGPQYENNNSFLSESVVNTHQIWWINEYQNFIEKIQATPNKQFHTFWNTGPNGDSIVYLTVTVQKDIVLMEMKLPKEAIFTLNKKTRKPIPSDNAPKIKIRDLDKNGYPNDFFQKPGTPPKKAIMSTDGFIKLQNTEEYQSIFFQWVMGIGFAINESMHGTKSAYPVKHK